MCRLKERLEGVQIVGIKDLHAFLEGLPVWMSERTIEGHNRLLWSLKIIKDKVPVYGTASRRCVLPQTVTTIFPFCWLDSR